MNLTKDYLRNKNLSEKELNDKIKTDYPIFWKVNNWSDCFFLGNQKSIDFFAMVINDLSAKKRNLINPKMLMDPKITHPQILLRKMILCIQQ
jgi:hypothetical protein